MRRAIRLTDAPAAGWVDNRMVSAMRLVLALSALFITGFNLSPAGFGPAVKATLVLYVSYSATLYVIAVRRHALLPVKIAHWLDVSWYTMLIAFSGGCRSIFFFYYFFAVLVASFRWGFVPGLRVTLGSALLFAMVSCVTSPGEFWTVPESDVGGWLLRTVGLLVLGYMVAYWGGHEITLKRRLALLRDITTLSNPRFGVDHTIGALMERVRAFYDADTCLLIELGELRETQPGASLSNGTGPDGTGPDATGSNMAAPSATVPNATAPNAVQGDTTEANANKANVTQADAVQAKPADTTEAGIPEPSRIQCQLRRVDRRNPEAARLAEPIPPGLSQRLLDLRVGLAVAYSSNICSWWRPLRRYGRYYAYDIATGERTTEGQESSSVLADVLSSASFIAVPVTCHNQMTGRVYVTSHRKCAFDDSDVHFILQVIEHVTPIIDNIRLVDRLASDAAEEERQRIARNIHDSVIQPYIGVQLGLDAIYRKYAMGVTDVRGDLEHLRQVASGGLSDLRGFMRSLQGAGERESSLLPAVRRFSAKFTAATGIAVQIESDAEVQISDRLAAEAFQMVTEGLSNVPPSGRCSTRA